MDGWMERERERERESVCMCVCVHELKSMQGFIQYRRGNSLNQSLSPKILKCNVQHHFLKLNHFVLYHQYILMTNMSLFACTCNVITDLRPDVATANYQLVYTLQLHPALGLGNEIHSYQF